MTQAIRKGSTATLELVTAAHVVAFIVAVSWAFGGNADWVRTPLSVLGSVGIAIFAASLAVQGETRRTAWHAASWAVPIVLLNALVLVSCLTPGFQRVTFGGAEYFMPVKLPLWRPSSAAPETSLGALWLFDGIYFSALNIAATVRRRSVIRAILAAIVANALLLSTFGIAQKLSGATGIYFGRVKSPQDYFFASFVYDNHWGAFAILMLGACIGLILRSAQGRKGGGFLRSPALTGFVAVVVIAATVPLSGARICSAMTLVLIALSLAKGAPRIATGLKLSGAGRAASVAALALAVAFGAFSIWYLSSDVIETRAAKTKDQIEDIFRHKSMGARSIVYHDTWRMAEDRIVFGWGMGSFPRVFGIYNTQGPSGDHIPVVYHDAHSDWLQSISELGLAGSFLILTSVLLPAAHLWRKSLSSLPYFLLTGCVLIAAYAWIEFPFGNVAVVLSWWICFICAVQYARLSGTRSEGAPQGR